MWTWECWLPDVPLPMCIQIKFCLELSWATVAAEVSLISGGVCCVVMMCSPSDTLKTFATEFALELSDIKMKIKHVRFQSDFVRKHFSTKLARHRSGLGQITFLFRLRIHFGLIYVVVTKQHQNV